MGKLDLVEWPLALLVLLVALPVLGSLIYVFANYVWEDPLAAVRELLLPLIGYTIGGAASLLYMRFRKRRRPR